MRNRAIGLLLLGAAALAACDGPAPTTSTGDDRPALAQRVKEQPSGNPAVIAMMRDVNRQLKARGLNVRLESIEYFTVGRGRPGDRLHQFDTRWVPGDPNRDALGNSIRFMITSNRGATTSGLTAGQTGGAIRSAMGTWAAAKPLRSAPLVEVTQPAGVDVTVIDKLLAGGAFDDRPTAPLVLFAADITHAGFAPRGLFESLAPGGGGFILAFSPSLIFVDENDVPLDSNGDNYIDVALNEVYYNDTWGDPAAPDPADPNAPDPKDHPWGIDVNLPGIDVESTALHETGHSFQIGHFGPPPKAVMNASYGGALQSLLPTDLASMNPLWMRWPK
jgi:hypothetical protein